MEAPRRVLLVALSLILSASASSFSSIGKIGCLFEEDLCSSYEFCTNDGVFGRCQSVSDSELYTYQVSSSTLEQLRLLLQQLAQRGLTWQDDLTSRWSPGSWPNSAGCR
ncbi:solute carrier organic anion transporter family member 5A1b, partial [Gadus morhua]|uniref:solute carrier organic anion transporter family member 5A1b n=1 Tax=Gadus morhua TaxID=8049 RepID=UPI0011B5E571